MTDWALVSIVAILAAYKLIDRWLDSRGGSDEYRETDTYSATETMPHEVRDDSERLIPDVRLGFQRETR